MLAVAIDSWIPFVFWYVLWKLFLATSVLLLVVLQREMEEQAKTSEMETG